jgi:hypothetical protein
VREEPPLPCDEDLVHDTVVPTGFEILGHDTDDDVHVRDVHPPVGSPDDVQALLDEVAEHDTVVLGRSVEDREAEDPRARIPAWEDIVFGVRRHR